MIHLTATNFEIETKKSPFPVLVMFYAAWCGKCAMMKPVVEELEMKYQKKIRFCEVDIDESEALAAKYEADIIPTFVFFRNGQEIQALQGTFSEQTFEKQMRKIFHIS